MTSKKPCLRIIIPQDFSYLNNFRNQTSYMISMSMGYKNVVDLFYINAQSFRILYELT